jgi:AraC-like DNA-binding protein
VVREARSIGSADPDLFKVTLHRRGSMVVEQDGRQSVAFPGDLVVFDTSRPYELSSTEPLEVAVFTAPRAMFGAGADLLGRRTAAPVASDSGLRSVIAAFLSGVADQLGDLPGPNDLRLADALSSLIIATFTEANPERAEAPTALTERILSYTLANLGDPSLSVESVARRHGVSTRYVHKLLRRHDISFAAWVRRERLARIRRDLLDPALARRTVSAIAARWGIADPGHLARAFRAEFGHTAADLRRSR